MKKILLLIIFLLVIPTITADKGHMYLLAVRETSKGYKGSTADLYLEIQPGEGRVFLETFPLAKIDTQISTRFAKEIACNYLEKNCAQYDFFYTIKSDSAIIGGPSAGSAIAILTVAVLEGIPIKNEIAMTGTINSGGLIGPVSGLKAKIEVAKTVNITRVLIPLGEGTIEEENETIDLIKFGQNQSVEVIEVGDMTEALYHYTGKWYKETNKQLVINKNYEKIMKLLALKLCERTKNLQKEENKIAENLTMKSRETYSEGKYYTAASYCFGANVIYRQQNFDNKTNITKIQEEIDELHRLVNKKEIRTISDLETYIIVKERLKDAQDYLIKANESKKEVARAQERIYSARTWSWFFEMPGKEYEFNRQSLREGCIKKLDEAEERYQYSKLFFPKYLEGTRKQLDHAYDDYENGDYALCIFKASKAKAEVGTILGVIGVREEQVQDLLNNKLRVAERIIADQEESFPILGYSYYEYATSLKDDESSALLYAEYALELSNLRMYFKEKQPQRIEIDMTKAGLIMVFFAGTIFGIFLTLLSQKYKTRTKRPKTRLRGKKR